ncbi:MAG TPA: hypothetical protein VK184_04390 [Nostocaceae cyanobacterium]|nr:hypothetical protein [Nostocaceae cyanobacterium]
MLNLEKLAHEELLTELSAESAANINGGQAKMGDNGDDQGEKKQSGKRYLQALGAAYLLPPGNQEITDDEALLAQKIAWGD